MSEVYEQHLDDNKVEDFITPEEKLNKLNSFTEEIQEKHIWLAQNLESLKDVDHKLYLRGKEMLEKWRNDLLGDSDADFLEENMDEILNQLEIFIENSEQIEELEKRLISRLDFNESGKTGDILNELEDILSQLIKLNPFYSQEYEEIKVYINTLKDTLMRNNEFPDHMQQIKVIYENIKDLDSERLLLIEKYKIADKNSEGSIRSTSLSYDMENDLSRAVVASREKKLLKNKLEVLTVSLDHHYGLALSYLRKQADSLVEIIENFENEISSLEFGEASERLNAEGYLKTLKLNYQSLLFTMARLDAIRNALAGFIEVKDLEKQLNQLQNLGLPFKDISVVMQSGEIIVPDETDNPILLAYAPEIYSKKTIGKANRMAEFDFRSNKLLESIDSQEKRKVTEKILEDLKQSVILIECGSPRTALEVLKDIQSRIVKENLEEVFKDFKIIVDLHGVSFLPSIYSESVGTKINPENQKESYHEYGFTLDELITDVQGKGVFNLSEEYFLRDFDKHAKITASIAIILATILIATEFSGQVYANLARGGLIPQNPMLETLLGDIMCGYGVAGIKLSMIDPFLFGQTTEMDLENLTQEAIKNIFFSKAVIFGLKPFANLSHNILPSNITQMRFLPHLTSMVDDVALALKNADSRY